MSNLRFVEKLANAPWLCDPEHVEFLHSIFLRYLDRAASGERFDREAVERSIGRPLDNTREVTIKNGVAKIPVEGTIMRRASLFTEMSGGVSTETLAKDFVTTYNDATVHSILFVFDSPGGELAGVNELANLIREKRDLGEKRIEAYCDGLCASAAYWLASATSKITTDATASLGSIGVVTRIRNPDAAGKKQDLEFWNTRSPNKRPDPNSQAGKATIQEHVDHLGDHFIATVADNRGVSVETVERDFGRGFVLAGERAVKAGLADAIGSEEGVVASLIERERSPQTIGVAAAHEGERPLAKPGHELHSGVLATQDKEEELTTQSEAEQSARGILSGIRRLLGVEASVPDVSNYPPEGLMVGEIPEGSTYESTTDSDEPEASEVSGEEEPDAAHNGKEPDSGMDEGQETTAIMDNEERSEATDTQANGREDLATREELEALRAELETERAKNAQTSAVLRERGIDRLLATRSTVVLENGARGAMPKAQRDAAKSLIASLAEAGSDPIELSASGEATLANTDAGKAVAQLIAPWKPVELGERGTQDGEAQSEGPQGDHERVLAVLEERGLGMEHYGAVAGELAAKGEIRRED